MQTTDLTKYTSFFLTNLFIKPFGLGSKLVSAKLDLNTLTATFIQTVPGNFITVTRQLPNEEKALEFQRLLSFMDVASQALKFEVIEVVETVIMHLLDGIVTGSYSVVPVIDNAVLDTMEDGDSIIAFNTVSVSHYVIDGVQCKRSYLSQVRLDLGEPIGLQIPYSYLVMIVGNKVAFNQTLSVGHNVLSKDEDNQLYQPIATGHSEYVGNGLIKIKERNTNRCVVESDTTNIVYDLLGIKPV